MSQHSKNSTIVIDHKYLDWIRRNPRVFVNGLVSRLENEETDHYPGFARWNGDAMPGVQVVTVTRSDFPVVIITADGKGKKAVNVNRISQSSSNDVEALKALAKKLGYNVRKKSASTSSATSTRTAAANKKVSRKRKKNHYR